MVYLMVEDEGVWFNPNDEQKQALVFFCAFNDVGFKSFTPVARELLCGDFKPRKFARVDGRKIELHTRRNYEQVEKCGYKVFADGETSQGHDSMPLWIQKIGTRKCRRVVPKNFNSSPCPP